MDIDIYDFDKTIVPFDSGSLFWGYCLVHYPWIAIFLPIQLVATILGVTHIINFTQYKKICFMFVPLIPLEKAVKGFWDKHEPQVHKWFYDRKRYSVVISASPSFLLKDISERLKFDKLICTIHNDKTGAIIGENCRNEEKVRRLYQEFDKDDINVVDVYSDSIKHDQPIFSLGSNCYHIVKGEKIQFNYNEVYSK